VRPDLVGEKDGYLTVDYEQLLQEVEEDGSH
jgi:flagellar capping protein FliD